MTYSVLVGHMVSQRVAVFGKWRYNYPKYDETSGYVKVPSQQLSDAMVEAFKDRLKND